MRLGKLLCASIFLTVLLFQAGVSADEQAADDNWEIHIRPYVWITGMEGTFSGSGLPKLNINNSFGDILEKFDSGALLAIEGQRGNFGFYTDILHVRLSDSGIAPPGIPAKARTSTTSALFAATYEVFQSKGYDLSALAGLRYWSLDLNAEINTPPTPLNIARTTSWVDPGLGLKGKYQVNPRLQTNANFVFFMSKKISWDIGINMQYSIGGNSRMILGYRYLTMNRDRPSFKLNTKLQGPVVGLDFRI